MNLLSSFADDDDGGKEDIEGLEIENLDDDEVANWIGEYQAGCDWEIYKSELSDAFTGTKFSTLASNLYQRVGVVLFALQVQDLKKDKSSMRMILNPADFVIPSKDDFKVDAFVIATDKAHSNLMFDDNDTDDKSLQAHRISTLALINNNIASEVSEEEAKEVSEEKPEVQKHAWQALLRKYDSLSQSADSQQEVIQKMEDVHLKENFFVRDKPAELFDSIIKTSVTEEIPQISGHTIIIGKSLNSLYDLIRPLRAKYLGNLKYIVILYPDDIPHAVWQRISIFEGILIVRGSPLEDNDIRRAGIFKADNVVVLSSNMSIVHEVGRTSAGNDALLDADSIFTYQTVRRMNEDAHVVVEIVRHQNVRYLDPESGLNSGEVDYKFTPQFSSGALFTSSLLDTLVCQVRH